MGKGCPVLPALNSNRAYSIGVYLLVCQINVLLINSQNRHYCGRYSAIEEEIYAREDGENYRPGYLHMHMESRLFQRINHLQILLSSSFEYIRNFEAEAIL
jgi:hypothetical protein